MPELPEVETVRAGLEKYVLNKRISSAHSYHLRAIKPSSISPLKALVGAKIKAVKRRGKFLWFELDRDFVLNIDQLHTYQYGEYNVYYSEINKWFQRFHYWQYWGSHNKEVLISGFCA